MTKRIKMQGLIVGDFHGDKELMHEFRTNMAQYVQEGKVQVREHLTEGIENAGTAFIEVGGGRGGDEVWLQRAWRGAWVVTSAAHTTTVAGPAIQHQ